MNAQLLTLSRYNEIQFRIEAFRAGCKKAWGDKDARPLVIRRKEAYGYA